MEFGQQSTFPENKIGLKPVKRVDSGMDPEAQVHVEKTGTADTTYMRKIKSGNYIWVSYR
jgi:hypothetical protein